MQETPIPIAPWTYAELVEALPSDIRAQLKRNVGGRRTADVLTRLRDPRALHKRRAQLPDDAADLFDRLLHDPLAEHMPLADLDVAQALIAEGLALPAPLGDFGPPFLMLTLPLEVRVTFHEPHTCRDVHLATCLSLRDRADLEVLAAVHHHDMGEPEAEPLQEALELARSMLSEEALDAVQEALDSGMLDLLRALAEAPSLVSERWIEDRAAQAGVGSAATRLLHRLGYLQPAHQEAHWIMPVDLRIAVIDGALHERAAMARDLVENALQQAPLVRKGAARLSIHRDLVQKARAAALHTLHGAPRYHHDLAAWLTDIGLLLPDEDAVADFASHVLDVSSGTTFLRHTLRLWLTGHQDPWTQRWLGIAGTDPETVIQHLDQALAVPREAGTASTAIERDLESWRWYLLQVRGGLLFCLSTFEPGRWYAMEDLGDLLHHLHVLAILQAGGFSRLHAWVPPEWIPQTDRLTLPETREACQRLIDDFVEEVLEPLGAAERDASGRMVQLYAPALNVFRDDEPALDAIWALCEPVLGSEIDTWQPAAVDPGARVHGTAPLLTVGDDGILVPEPCHWHDLRTLAEWARFEEHAEGYLFRFRPDTVRESTRTDSDHERMLTWLTVRTHGALPDALRALFPLSSSASDGGLGPALAHARAEVRELVEVAATLGHDVPLLVAERLRAWAQPAAEVLRTEALERYTDTDAWGVFLLLLGELGDAESAPIAVRTLVEATGDPLEGIASATAARLGAPSLPELLRTLQRASDDENKLLIVVATLSHLASLHPVHATGVLRSVGEILMTGVFEPEMTTHMAVHLLETGHPLADSLIQALREQGHWSSDAIPDDEVDWIRDLAPTLYGHPLYAYPLALILRNADETEALAERLELEPLLLQAGLSVDSLTGRSAGSARRRRS